MEILVIYIERKRNAFHKVIGINCFIIRVTVQLRHVTFCGNKFKVGHEGKNALITHGNEHTATVYMKLLWVIKKKVALVLRKTGNAPKPN